MESNKNQLQPNSTQIPHIIIRDWMPLLKDVELRVLLVVADQTLGWIEDPETGRRKERDWISRWQLEKKTGKGHTAVSKAIEVLNGKIGIIQAIAEDGTILDTPEKRSKHGSKIYYRLTLKKPPQTLFGDRTPPQSGRVRLGHPATKWPGSKTSSRPQKTGASQDPATFQPGHKADTTKQTVSTKEIQAKAGKPNHTENEEKSQGHLRAEVPHETPSTNKTPLDNKKPLPTIRLISCFKRYAEEIRKQSPQFERGKDGNLIKAALRHLREDQLELHMIWFLQSQPKMKTTIGAALCKESIQGFIDAARSEQGFYLRMSDTWKQFNKAPAPDPYGTAGKLALLKKQLAEKLATAN